MLAVTDVPQCHAAVEGVKVDEHTRHPVPPGTVLNASRPAVPVPREPSWGRVLVTTIKVWVAWRLRSLGFGPQGASGRSGRAPFGRPASRLTTSRWHLAALALALAVIAVITLQFTDVFTGTGAPAARALSTGSPAARTPGRQPPSPSLAAVAQAQAAAWMRAR